ncbi:MAG: hypothetical protein U0325_24720 [Polyangiales bacterium]
MSRKVSRAPWLSVLTLALASHCAEERTPINRVQPDFLDKSDLIPVEYAVLRRGATTAALTPAMRAQEPVFYTQTTLIAKPSTGGFVGVTDYSPLEKVRWEITENLLLARRAYAFVRNAPGAPNGIGQSTDGGAIVAAFAIRSHFDVRRSYNEGTGEESNVVEENTSDRPWYQRQFVRVDWSRNLVESYGSPLEYERWRGQVRAEPVPVFANTPDDPNRPVFDYQGSGASRRLAYFDVVNRAVLHPETVSFGDEEPFVPLCALYDLAGTLDCAPAEVTMRLSFRRAETRDYEPATLTVPTAPAADRGPTHLDMERFGFFDVTRVGYDPVRAQVLDTERTHLATRHNLFVHHHAPAVGASLGRACDGDADCGEGNVCVIASQRAAGRGTCARRALEHVLGDRACTADLDCAGVSATARCDAATRTCGDLYLRCANDTDCARVHPQSTCDTVVAQTRGDNRGLCRLPYRQRQVRPVVYHLSANYPDDMLPVTASVVADWNRAFRDAVASARRRECQIERGVTLGAQPDPCNDAAVTGVEGDARFAFVACHSPVWGSDPAKPGAHSASEVQAAQAAGWDLPSCGPQGTRARLGDLRYNLIGAITEYDREGYWGLANIAADPETGEMVAGRGAVWQTATDAQAAQLVDWVQLLAGSLRPEQVVRGDHILATLRQAGAGRSPSHEVLDAPLRTREGLSLRAAQTARALEGLRSPGAGFGRPGMRLVSRDPERPGARALAVRRVAQSGSLGDGTSRASRLRARLRGTDLERALMTPAQVRLAPAGHFDRGELTDDVLRRASPLRGQSPAARRALRSLRTQLQQHQCDLHAGVSDGVLEGIARRIATGEPIRAQGEDADMAFGRDWVFRRADGTLDLDTVRLWARQFVHQGVLAHEIGHSLGMRHNFASSADALNYHDRYWRLRAQGHRLGLRPRYEYLGDPTDGAYYSDAEREGRVEEYAYASVMDYRGINEDAHGLGRYDRAFIKHGYVGMVEAFREVAQPGRALQWGMNTMGGGFSTNYDLQAWSGGGAVRGIHYTHIPEFHGARADGTPAITDDNRYDVFLRETRAREVPGFGDPSFTNVTDDGHLLVPYRFDSDERAGLVWQNQPYDAGADAYESVHYVAGRWLDHYFLDSFARRRSGFSTEGYVNRQWGRYLENLRQVTQLLAFDRIIDDDFFAGARGWDAWRTDPAERAGVLNDATVAAAVDAMTAQLLMPEVGDHGRRTTVDNVTWAESDPADATFVNVPLNRGRYFESTWRFDQGWWWYEQLDRAGSFYDKTMSLQALVDPDLSLVGRDTAGDIRLFQLNAFTIYPAQMTRLFGALLAEDYADFAPIIRTDGEFEVQRTNVATLNLAGAARGRTLDATHVPLDPQTGFTLQVWSAALTMSGFPATFDRRYLDAARLWIDGSGEAISVDDPARNTVSYTDPWTRQVFRAQHLGAAAGEPGADVGASALVHRATGMTANETGIAARMLLHAADLEAAWRDAQRARDAAGAARWESALRRYLDLLRVMRDLTRSLDAVL